MLYLLVVVNTARFASEFLLFGQRVYVCTMVGFAKMYVLNGARRLVCTLGGITSERLAAEIVLGPLESVGALTFL
eukprot:3263751-Pyramimonas_sp.AAC.1